eukprot:Phypoly_transcript_18818.p1 GENE.Phypoly_transcript_18818~~Phypoly_transcript_18818.p1  ORF type:complete len:199 (+),score=17.74 Phypoly_transcript_18818:47-598(+)
MGKASKSANKIKTKNKNVPNDNHKEPENKPKSVWRTWKTWKRILLVLLSLTVLSLAFAVATMDYEQLVKCGTLRAARVASGSIRIVVGFIIMFAGFLQITLGTLVTLTTVVLSLGIGTIVYTLHFILGSFIDFTPLLDIIEGVVQYTASQGGQDNIFKAMFSPLIDPLVAVAEKFEAIIFEGC